MKKYLFLLGAVDANPFVVFCPGGVDRKNRCFPSMQDLPGIWEK